MGTSVSFRSPSTPRWQAFRAALESSESLERTRAELFSAGASWSEEIASDALGPFVRGVITAYDNLGASLAETSRPEQAVVALVGEARKEVVAGGAPAALAIAERALQQTLIAALRADSPLAETSSQQAAERWEASRGDSAAAFAVLYLAEVVRQFAQHAASREAAAIFKQTDDVGRTREVTRELGRSAAELARSVEINDRELRSAPEESWANAVRSVFSSGRQWPPPR